MRRNVVLMLLKSLADRWGKSSLLILYLKIWNPIWALFFSVLSQDHQVDLHVCNWKQYWTAIIHFSSWYIEQNFTLFFSLGSAMFKFLFLRMAFSLLFLLGLGNFFFLNLKSTLYWVVFSRIGFWADTYRILLAGTSERPGPLKVSFCDNVSAWNYKVPIQNMHVFKIFQWGRETPFYSHHFL